MPELESRIEAVTVYTDRARVRRRGRIRLPSGAHELVLRDLPLNVVPESVRASARATVKCRLLGSDVGRSFHEAPVEQRPSELQAEIQALEDRDCELLRAIEAFTARRRFLDSLASALGPELARGLAYGRSTIEAGTAASTFLGEQFALVDRELQRLEVERREIGKRLEALRATLDQLGRTAPKQRRSITVSVQMEEAGEIELDVSYQVTGASWEPLYDLRIGDGRLALSYLAQVTQSTGEPWHGVALSLSTAKPALSLQFPELQPWFLNVMAPPPPMVRARAVGVAVDFELAAAAQPVPVAPAMAPPEAELREEADIQFAQTEETGASVTFHLVGGTDIPDDGSPHKVTVADHDLPARFDYVTAPKLVSQAYRRARITNAGPALLLPGAAQVFDGEEYIGATRLKTVAPGQDFELFLGIDDRIQVERKLIEGSVDKKLLVDVRRLTYAYEVKVRNLTTAAQTVTVWDQQPVPRHEQVKVRRTEARPAPAEDTELGKLAWELPLAPGQEAVIRLGFVIEAPRDLQLVGLPPLKE